MAKNDLFNNDLKVINIGLSSFKDTIKESDAEVIQVDWKPPTQIDERILQLLSKMNPISKNRIKSVSTRS